MVVLPTLTMNAAAINMWLDSAPLVQRHQGATLLDESTGFLGLGRSLTFPFPQYRADDEHRTVYFDEGAGRTLVFVHGLGANATHWQPLVQSLVHHYRVVGLDLVGLGWTKKPDLTYDVDMIRDHLLGFLSARGIERATLISHSMGGAVALAAAVEQPDLVEGIVLISAAGIAPLPKWMQLAAPLALRRSVLYPMLGLGADFILRNVFVDSPDENPNVKWFYDSALRDGPGAHNLLDFARVCETLCVDITRRDYSIYFPEMKVPTLAIWGDHDKLTTLGKVFERLEALPRLRTVLMKDTGHMPMIERPVDTLHHLERFLLNPP